MSSSDWPSFPEPPSVAFVDVDGTLLAQTTTFLFARILYRRGLIRRSFFLRALYHGLQHRFGRLDYGRLIEIGLTYIQRIPVVELERIAYENFVEFVRPRLYEGVVEHFASLAAGRDADRAGLVVARAGDRAAGHLPGLHRPADDSGRDRTRPAGRHRDPGRRATAKASSTGPSSGRPNIRSPWTRRSPTPITGAIGPCSSRSAGPWSSIRGAGSSGWPGPGGGTSSGRDGPSDANPMAPSR